MRKLAGFVIPLSIFIAALTLRIFFIKQVASSPMTFFSVDDAYYNSWASEIAKGDLLGKEVFYGLPLYPYLLGFLYFLFGHSVYIGRIMQISLGSLNCVLLYFLGKKAFGKGVGLMAAIILTFYGMSLYLEGFLNSVPLSLTLNINSLLLLFSLMVKSTTFKWAALGFIFGLSSLTNASVILFMFLIIPWAVKTFSENGLKNTLMHLSIMAAVFLAVVCIVTCRNYYVGKDFVPITSHAGITFYAGNNRNATGTFYLPAELGNGIERTKYLSTQLAEKESGKKLKPSEVSRFWFNKALGFIKNDPAAFLKLILKKIYYFWWIREIPEVMPSEHIKTYAPAMKLSVFNYAFISPLAIVGLLLSFRMKKPRVIVLYIGAVFLSVLLYFVNSRYRMAAEPLLVLFASYTLFVLYKNIKHKDYRQPLLIVLGGVILFFALNLEMGKFTEETAYCHMGVLYLQKGMLKEAEESFKKALEINPADPISNYNLGLTHEQRGEYGDAIKKLEDAIRVNPEFGEAYMHAGIVYANMGRLAEAEKAFKRTVEIDPHSADGFNNLGLLYLKRGDYNAAIENYKKALILKPDCVQAHNNIAFAYDSTGQFGLAIEHFEYSLKIQPSQKDIKNYLANLKNRILAK